MCYDCVLEVCRCVFVALSCVKMHESVTVHLGRVCYVGHMY